MRFVLFFAVVSLLAQEPPSSGKIQGRVIDQATREPIARARVTLRSTPPLSAETDANGAFLFPEVAPQLISAVTAQKQGYVTGTFGVRSIGMPPLTIRVEPGGRVSGVDITLTQQAVIAGTVTDGLGDPMPRALVTLQRKSYVLGKPEMVNAGGAQADDRGAYRFAGLAPGTYYVHTTDPAISNVSAVIRNPQREGNVATYYGGSAEASRAVPISVKAGEEVRGIDIRLIRTALFSVRGKMLDPSGAPFPRRGVTLRYPDGSAPLLRGLRITEGDGSFEFSGVTPGEYEIGPSPTFVPKRARQYRSCWDRCGSSSATMM